ncbi:MAG TPA: peptidoglycan-binding protein [Acidimicrobiales bacterium]|nr:peptidoglycan-binding protein [Acidimicrobiales bacterium]
MSPASNAPAYLPRLLEGSAEALPIAVDSAGKAVADLQSRLVRLGLLQVREATGIFDAATARAVSNFQRQRGLRCDGVCGRETWAAVVEAGFALGDRILYRRAPMFHGDDVAELQRRLSALGFDPGGVDGIFGDRTTEALGEFQRNVGLPADGICGYLTIAELTRLTIRPGGGDLVSTVRERLVAATRGASLRGRSIAVGEQGGFATGVGAVCRALAGVGAESLQLHHPDESEQAVAANRAGVDCYVGLRLEPQHSSVKTMYYRGYRYESETSRLLANLMREQISERLGFEGGSTEGMAVRILRETQMPAVLVELGDPSLVVMKVAELAQAVVTALEQWLMVDWESGTSSTT